MCVGVSLYGSLISYSASDWSAPLLLCFTLTLTLSHTHTRWAHTSFFSRPDQIRSEVDCQADVILWWVGFSFHALSIFLPRLSITAQICSMSVSVPGNAVTNHLFISTFHTKKKPSDRFSRIKLSFIFTDFFFFFKNTALWSIAWVCRLSLLCNISLSEGIHILFVITDQSLVCHRHLSELFIMTL